MIAIAVVWMVPYTGYVMVRCLITVCLCVSYNKNKQTERNIGSNGQSEKFTSTQSDIIYNLINDS